MAETTKGEHYNKSILPSEFDGVTPTVKPTSNSGQVCCMFSHTK